MYVNACTYFVILLICKWLLGIRIRAEMKMLECLPI